MTRAPLATLVLAAATTAAAQGTPKLDTGDTAFMLISAALVLLMTPGLAFFYGGLVRAKSVLNTMMMSFVAIAIVGVLWVLLGYSLAFGAGGNALIGSFANVGLNGTLGQLTGTIPTPLFVAFQAMFAIIAPALISGAVVDRMKFGAFVLFAALWTLLIYSPLAHMVWSSDGYLFKLGALDFAGGTVIHIAAGVSALVAAIVVGPRLGLTRRATVPHNVPFVLLGAGLLWFGWFGFNAGSALGANGVAANALLTTNTATAAAILAWLFWEVIRGQRPTAVGAATGAIVGLVAITPACGFVSPLASILIGVLGATASFWAVQLKHRFITDDALDVFACHGVAGIVGALLTGVFATKTVNDLGSGVIDGRWSQLGVQALGVLITVALAGIGSFLLLKLVGALMGGLRITERQETLGVDLVAHQEEGYREAESPLGTPVLLGGD
ncbi:ammonium transporter [Deinococcus maricopensis]|uniref:Ammonium transporter n=1 Tax=Deinococcus maricopensis (strain DSM 21211 / LMG 22137 / NRRL B-23946 / LB-34) TaxID=709986 RepID=E8UBF4_DEIML|nr:ammonium transporter [Deinococcus maricopensis]ADV68393.1 ammonium transporter [Deinococcus maricopensis DSM 21211]